MRDEEGKITSNYENVANLMYKREKHKCYSEKQIGAELFGYDKLTETTGLTLKEETLKWL